MSVTRFTTFPRGTLTFLRALRRNNDREWFRARKDEYDRVVRAPMIAMIERLAVDFRAFAPDLSASPKVSLYRIYRDTRFSDDKTPLKTHIAAIFPDRRLGKHQGAGLYVHVTPKEVWIGGGMYGPDTSQLHAEREHIAANHRRLRAIIESPAFVRTAGELEGEKLQRVPRGFDANHPASEYLKFRQYLAGHDYPASFATSPQFYAGTLKVFRAIAPLIKFLNEPLVGR